MPTHPPLFQFLRTKIMNTYLEKIQPLVAKYANEELFNNDAIIRSFAFFGAQLQAFETGVEPKKLLQLFRCARLHQALNLFDQDKREALALFDQPAWHKLRKYLAKPGIVATYHVGSYRLIGRWLMQQKLPFVLLVATRVTKQTAFSTYLQRNKRQGFQLPPILLAEDPHVIRKMCNYIKQGFYILTYVDGGRGCFTDIDLDRLAPVPFFSGKLYIHRGIPLLARLAECPIYPIVVPRTTAHVPKLIAHDPIYVAWDENTLDHLNAVLCKLFGILQDTLTQSVYLHQWEHWLSGQPTGRYRRNKKLRIEEGNAHRYFPYRSTKQCYMLCADTLMSYRISEDLYRDFVNLLKYLYI